MYCGELTQVVDLRSLDQSITLFGRAYFSAAFLTDWQQAGSERHWLMRHHGALGKCGELACAFADPA